MSLRKKTLLVLSVITVALLILLNGISWVFIRSNFQRLEKDEVQNQLDRALKAFSDNLEYMDTALRGLSIWNDSYAFITEWKQAFAESNADDWMLNPLRVDLILFLDSSCQVIFTTTEQDETQAPIVEGLCSYLSGQPESMKGIVILPEAPLLVARKPTFVSKGDGPAGGTLIVARYIDEKEIASLSELSNQPVDLRPIDAGHASQGDYAEAQDQLLRGEESFLKPVNDHRIAGYAVVDDIQGNPALILKVETNRDIYKGGLLLMTYFSIFLFVACLIFGLAIWLLLEKLVIRRVATLSNEITEIGASSSRDARVEVAGGDELSSLELSINTMLEKIEQSEERFRSVIENASDIILVIGGESKITYESPSIESTLGYAAGELLGQPFYTLMHEDDMKKAREGWRNLLAHPGETERREVRFIHKDGTWIDFEAIAYNLLEDPAVKGVVVNARDITERRLMTERLEKLNEVFLNQGPNFQENVIRIVVACRDILGAPLAAYYRIVSGKFYILSTDANVRVFEMADAVAEKMAYEMITGDSREPLLLTDLAAGEYRGSSQVAQKSGTSALAAYPVIRGEKTIGCLFAFYVKGKVFSTQEVKIMGTLAQALLVEEERLSQEQSLKDFIDVASHELRHPITLMKGYALTLRDYGERMDKDSRYNYLNIINEGADRLNELIKELLDISRIEQGRFLLKRENIALEDLLKRAIEEMAGKGFKDRFSLTVTGDLGSRKVDTEKLVRVLVILLDNAIQHSSDHGQVEVTGDLYDGAVRISVMDRGIGVPVEDREQIFERFYQVEDAIHHQSPGIGLGLYIAREIVKAHGGRIWYEPREGGGSIFRFTVP
ncbi:MAG: hypothetical protein A2W01_04915 [Candidatus Solincola sediminis]|uniref:Sensor-like histidine kinase SenX3 n=1 Tax=Candidatus Solincola sediminis TaxID=1797199 RepID=A0A1F2WFD1_9ACTN|nr:MAG: hypothetical protein A2Y75_09570 [Candidatus Solincola sediminis]OFW57767.1 MAG: hypothetical protein A2W01_04915 [Candidatus Solincola sediminis]